MVASGDILSNRYLLRGEVGVGGMGVVYDATDLHTGGQVAVKVLHAFHAANPQYISRLRREAQIAASIRSPRVVKVTDLGEDGPVHYLVMEFVAGETLAQKLKQQERLECDEALRYCVEIARALTAAHVAGVLHRDLKPENVKITDEGEVKVLDFGIARAQGQPGITSIAEFTGTPEYSAPERAAGEGDIRSDVYSIGVILYQLLAGQPPFSGGSVFAVLRRHETAPVPPLPVPVPNAVQDVLDRSLAKRPEERYQTPADLLAALRGAQESVLGERIGGGRPPPAFADEDRSPRTTAAVPPRLSGNRSGHERAEGSDGRPHTGGRRRVVIGTIAALLIAGGAAAAFANSRDEGDGTGTTPTPTRLAGGVTEQPTARPTPTPVPAPLLQPSEKIDLAVAQERPIPLCAEPNGNPRLSVILRVDSIELSADGKQTTVSYAWLVPRVNNVECPIELQPDMGTRQVYLETVSGNRSLRTPSSSGRGAGEAGAKDIYGTVASGQWIFDNVPLVADSLTLRVVSRVPDEAGRDLVVIPLLPKR